MTGIGSLVRKLRRIAHPPGDGAHLAAVPGVMDSSVWRKLLSWPVETGCDLSSGPNRRHERKVAPMIVRSRSHHAFAPALGARSALMPYAMAALIALALVGTACRASAQGATPNAAHQPSRAAVLLAKQILETKHADKIFEPLIRGVVIKTRDFFMQTNFMWAKDLNEVADNLIKEYSARSGELMNDAARIYASHFTEAELKQLLAFYQSPLGQKVIAEEPKTADESMAMAGSWADKLSEVVMSKMRDEMKKRGHDI
jgi:hypothetical protein